MEYQFHGRIESLTGRDRGDQLGQFGPRQQQLCTRCTWRLPMATSRAASSLDRGRQPMEPVSHPKLVGQLYE